MAYVLSYTKDQFNTALAEILSDFAVIEDIIVLISDLSDTNNYNLYYGGYNSTTGMVMG